jgi:hypothetical protein
MLMGRELHASALAPVLSFGTGQVTVKRKTTVKSFTRGERKAGVFSESGALNKHEIAMAIANRFPELAPRLPPFRNRG